MINDISFLTVMIRESTRDYASIVIVEIAAADSLRLRASFHSLLKMHFVFERVTDRKTFVLHSLYF